MPGAPTPKDRFTSLDTLALVRELRPARRGRIDKVFDLPGGGWVLSIRVPKEGRHELLLVPGRYAAWLSEASAHADELSPFARELRRLLEGSVLEEVPDPKGERLLELVLRRSDDPGPLRVALEMFGSGNLVVARGETIVAAAQSRRWAHRTVGVGAAYAHPPSRSDPFSLGVAETVAELSRSRTDLASTLGARFALGGALAEEVIARGGWDGTQPASSRADALGPELQQVLRQLFEEVGERPTGFLYRRDTAAVDATPYRSHRWRAVPGVEEVACPTFSLAASEYFPSLLAAPASKEDLERARAKEELDHQLGRQRAAVTALDQQVAELQRDAAAVLEHYPEAEAALSAAGRDPDAAPLVEVRLGDRVVSLRVGESPRAAAQLLFEEAKRLQGKLVGARHAVEATEGRLRDLATVAARPTGAPSPSRTIVVRTRRHWFEQFRWFLSSEGAIVVAGRDATSNDTVVKRHLKDGDVYVHADVHGAASVVVKHPEPGAPPLSDVTLREAGQWAVALSKAWRAGLASASAFWATPDQVSKTAESGEFVARGAWVIRGTKHLLRDLPLELAVGTIDVGGETLWTAAPPDAVRSRGTVRVIVTPGDERARPPLEVALCRELGIARPLLQSLLPAGGIATRPP